MTSKFITPLNVELVEGSDKLWTIETPLVYASDLLRRVITVPAGFTTDFASIPRLPLMFMLLGDTEHEAAVIHDYLYATGEVTRATADSVLHEASIASGHSLSEANAIWLGVRIGGWLAWNTHARERAVRAEIAKVQ